MDKLVKVVQPSKGKLALRWTNPRTGKIQQKSARTNNWREAERAAARLEADLQRGRCVVTVRIEWDEFRRRYEFEKLAGMADSTAHSSEIAFNHLERIVNPRWLVDVTSAALSNFQGKRREEGVKETTIASNLRHLRAALNWAASMELLGSVPRINMPKRSRACRLMRGRPITEAEFQRLLNAAESVRPGEEQIWCRFLRGLWLSGLRLGEALALGWDDTAAIKVDLSGRHARLRIWAEAEKANRDRLLPITPDFEEFLLATPTTERTGLVFRLPGRGGKQMQSGKCGAIVSKIGQAAGVVVNADENKPASAHDLRRSFAHRWSASLTAADLQKLLRHKSIETTLKYYAGEDSDDLAVRLRIGYNGNAVATALPQLRTAVGNESLLILAPCEEGKPTSNCLWDQWF